jgi:hypothetical protein
VSAIGPITISNVTTTAGFSEVDDCAGTTLNARQTCEIDVYFDPTTAGNLRGTLTIASNAYFAASGNTLILTGTGGGLEVSGSLAFGTQLINTTVSRTLTLTNSGSAVSIHGISLSSPTSFKLAGGTCPASGTVAAGASCTIIVSFDPTTIGGKKDTLVVSSSDPASPLLVPATGNGTEVQVSATTISFATITHGTNETSNLTVKNVGTTSLTVTPSISGTGSAAFSISTTGDTCSSAVPAGGSCTLPVKFAPPAGTNLQRNAYADHERWKQSHRYSYRYRQVDPQIWNPRRPRLGPPLDFVLSAARNFKRNSNPFPVMFSRTVVAKNARRTFPLDFDPFCS